MSELFYPVTIKQIIKETADASTIVLEIPTAYKEKFQYLPGQYLTFRAKLNNEEVRRAYSFSSSPYTDPNPAVTIKKVENGWFSVYANDVLKAGDVIEVMPPMGKFCVNISSLNMKHYVLFAGGSGITPIMSIAKSILDKEPFSKITLVYGNRNDSSVIFKSFIQELISKHANRFDLITSLDEGVAAENTYIGRPSKELYKEIVNKINQKSSNTKDYYICGPSGMMDLVKTTLTELNVPAENIHTEYFAAPIKSKENLETGMPSEAQKEVDFCEAEITINKKTTKVVVQKGDTILEAAKKADLDPPYACEMGVCTTCRAKLSVGKVTMDEREGLTDGEISKGYILTCQSHPTTPKVVLNFE